MRKSKKVAERPAQEVIPVVAKIVPAKAGKKTLSNGANGNNIDFVGIKAEAEKLKRGRRSKLTPKLWKALEDGLKEGKTLVALAKENKIGLPTIYDWRELSPEFAQMLASAREAFTHSIVQEGLDGIRTVDASTKESMPAVRKAEALAKHTLELAGRLNPADYSPKQQVQMDVRSVSIVTRSNRLQKLLDE